MKEATTRSINMEGMKMPKDRARQGHTSGAAGIAKAALYVWNTEKHFSRVFDSVQKALNAMTSIPMNYSVHVVSGGKTVYVRK
jgi:hypothetical protein